MSSDQESDPEPSGESSIERSLAADLARYDSMLERLELAAERIVAGGPFDDPHRVDFSASRLRDRLAQAGVIDMTDLPSLGAKMAQADRERFSYSYGGFAGSLDGIAAAVDAVEAQDPSDSSAKAVALLSLLRDRLDHLLGAADRLLSITIRAAAETRIRTEVSTFGVELEQLRGQVAAAASEFGLDVQKLNWGAYADAEGRRADRWRMGATLVLAAAALVSSATVLHLAQEPENWQEVGLRVLASLALGALAAYVGSQSAEHRRTARRARQHALDLATISPFVSRLAPAERNQILLAFGLARFGNSLAVDTENELDSTASAPQAAEMAATIAAIRSRLDTKP